VLTNDFIVKSIDGNVAEAEVLKMMRISPAASRWTRRSVPAQSSGVPDSVIDAMRNKN
jgi:hypothetical protein